MKKVAPKFEGNELFINGEVRETNPDGFLEEWDSVWVEVTNNDLMDIALKHGLVTEEEASDHDILDDIMPDLEPLYENWMIGKFIDKLKGSYENDIEECGGLEVIFENGKRIVIK